MAKIILVGVDNSDTARKAAEKAAALAQAFESDLHIITAFRIDTLETIRSIKQSTPGRPTSHSVFTTLSDRPGREAEAIAAEVGEFLKTKFPNLHIETRSVEGEPGGALVREAEKLAADIIVVGNKRVQGPSRFLGSIARTVASATDCDLYVVNTRSSLPHKESLSGKS